MRNAVLFALGLLVLVGVAIWLVRPVDTDSDADLVHSETLPPDFPLVALAEGEGELLDVMSREVSGIRTVTVQYALADDVDDAALIERYGKHMANLGGVPEHRGRQVRAPMPHGHVAAQVADRDGQRILTLQAVRTP